MNNILVIKHGAFGDFIMATGAFQAIRAYHPDDHITLLTSSPFEKFARQSDFFDCVAIDDRKPFWNLCALKKVRQVFKQSFFTRIYDLQTSSRTALYYKFLKHSKTEWVGHVPQSEFCLPKSAHEHCHVFERHRQQLALAGIKNVPDPSNEWLVKSSKIADELTGKFAIIVTGASAGHEVKCWPIENYLKICEALIAKGFRIVLTGTNNEASKIDFIMKNISDASQVSSLIGRADFYDYATLSQKAALIIGNDTGPFHLMAMSRIPAILLLSHVTDLLRTVPNWPSLSALKQNNIADITVSEVEALLTSMNLPDQ